MGCNTAAVHYENIIRTTHSPRVVAEEREIHRLPLWGTGLCYKQQLNAEKKEDLYCVAGL